MNSPVPPPFCFASQTLPGARLNQYGIVTYDGTPVSPAMRGIVLREALAAGCRQVPSPDPDIGLIWTDPASETAQRQAKE